MNLENSKIDQSEIEKDSEKEITKPQKKKKTKYIDMEYTTPAFRNIIQNYKATVFAPSSSQLVTIESCLQDFRSEKIKRLTDEEVIMEELGDEMKNFENEKIFRKKSNLKINKEEKKRESKLDFLTILNFAKKNKIILPAIQTTQLLTKKEKSIEPLKKFDLNIVYKSKLFRGRKIKKTHLYAEQFKSQDTAASRIDTIATTINNDSEQLLSNQYKRFNELNERFEDWKRSQALIGVKRIAVKNGGKRNSVKTGIR